ncbi:MAG: energy-coupling factor transporter transmembrane protein EcfT, partial [Thermofilum sp.]|nr:energy-coupling factor transporter transmembrane protein EcfT [Thermofilum sp.]
MRRLEQELRSLNPSVKLLLLLAGVFHAALLSSAVVLLTHVLTATALVALGRVRVRRGFALGALTTLAGYTWVNYALFVSNLGLSPEEALARVLLLDARIASIILYSAFFVGTTDPVALATSLSLQLRVPYVYAFMSFVTLRSAPVILGDLENMMVFRRVKGYLSWKHPYRYLLSLLMPILYLSARRATLMAIAMESRGFGKYPHRTYMKPTEITL